MGPFRHAASQAQARARHASLLDAGSWRDLLAESSLEGVADRLGRALDTELPASPTALERHLQQRLAAETHTLASLQWGAPRRLLVAYARRFELANLKTLLRARHHGVAVERCEAMLVPLPVTALPWRAVLAARSVEEVAELLTATPYARPITTVLEQRGEAPPFPLEVALDLAYLQTLVRRVLALGGADGRRARAFLGEWIAVENLSWAFRYRRLAGLTPEETVNYTLHRAFGAGLAAVRRVATGAGVAEEAARLGYEIDAELPEEAALASLQRAALRRRFDAAARLFDRAVFDLGVVLALLALREAELADLVTLIEGRAEGLGRDDVQARLVGPGRRGEA